jgi:hypothetical protein
MAGILHTIQEYMKTKFASIPTDEGSRQHLLQNVHKKLLPGAEIAIDKPVTMAELQYAVQKGKSNKAPGGNGIGHDFFKTMWGTIKYERLEIVNEMYTGRMISDARKYGLIVCVPKKPRSVRPDDFQHLALLNADLNDTNPCEPHMSLAHFHITPKSTLWDTRTYHH